MAKTRKCMDLAVEGLWFECIIKYGGTNPYRLYVRTFSEGSWHRKQIAAYGNFLSVIEHIRQFGYQAHWGFKDSY